MPLWKGHLPCMGNCYCTFAHLCGPDLMKEIAPARRQLQGKSPIMPRITVIDALGINCEGKERWIPLQYRKWRDP